MTVTLLDIGDMSIRLWQEGELVCDSPSVAHSNRANLTFGKQALAKSRSEPQGLYSRHWSTIDTAPLGRATKTARHHADLVYRHLAELQKQYSPIDDLIIMVPSGLNTKQLSLLLGITQSLSFNVVGLVDSAVANVACIPSNASVNQFIELGSFRTTVAKVLRNGRATFESLQSIESVGQDYLTKLCLDWVADCFLDQARFDPLQQAETEQLIFDHLESWLGALDSAPNINVEIQHLERRHSVSLSRNALLEKLHPTIELLTETIDPKYPVVLSYRFNLLPSALFNRLADKTAVIRTNSNDAFIAVEQQLEDVLCAPEEIVFTRQLAINPTTSREQADGS